MFFVQNIVLFVYIDLLDYIIIIINLLYIFCYFARFDVQRVSSSSSSQNITLLAYILKLNNKTTQTDAHSVREP